MYVYGLDTAVLIKVNGVAFVDSVSVVATLFNFASAPISPACNSGTSSGLFPRSTYSCLLYTSHPEYKQDPSVNVVLSYTVYGGYYAFFENRQYGDATVVDIISQISSEAMNLL